MQSDTAFPLVSVIVPVYNTVEYLEQCLDSIINQTYKNLEILVIDDGSTDGSSEVIDSYAQKDERVIAVHQENQGLVQSRKNGLSMATGKYAGFVDSDDWIEPEMFEYLATQMIKYQADIVTTGRIVETDMTLYAPDKIRQGVYNPLEDPYFCKNMIWSEKKELWGISPNFWNKLFLRDKLLQFENKVDNRITYGEDDVCVYPYMAFSKTAVITEPCFYHYRIRKTSMSSSADDYYFERINRIYILLKESFEKHPLSSILLHELGLYMTEFAIRGINSLWGLKTNIQVSRYIVDYSFLFSNQKAILYGAGNVGRELYKELENQHLAEHVLWVDKQFEKYRPELNVESPEMIKKIDYTAIVVAVYEKALFEEIRKELIKNGVHDEKIVWFKESVKSIFEEDYV